jgi:hypothetical protein
VGWSPIFSNDQSIVQKCNHDSINQQSHSDVSDCLNFWLPCAQVVSSSPYHTYRMAFWPILMPRSIFRLKIWWSYSSVSVRGEGYVPSPLLFIFSKWNTMLRCFFSMRFSFRKKTTMHIWWLIITCLNDIHKDRCSMYGIVSALFFDFFYTNI